MHAFNEEFIEREENFVIESKRVKDNLQAALSGPLNPEARAKALTVSLSIFSLYPSILAIHICYVL